MAEMWRPWALALHPRPEVQPEQGTDWPCLLANLECRLDRRVSGLMGKDDP